MLETNLTNSTGTWPNVTGVIEGTSDTSSELIMYLFMSLPGIILNIAAMVIIRNDATEMKLPTSLLFFLLCLFDMIALINTLVWYAVGKVYPTPSDLLCSIKVIFNPYFSIYTGLISALLSIDRLIALAKPFYYRKKITSEKWILIAGCAAIFTLVVTCLPVFGLGSVWSDTDDRACSSLTYQKEAEERVFLIVYGLLGCFYIAAVIVCNVVVIDIALRMKKRVVPEQVLDTQDASHSTSVEILFAQLVGVTTILYVACWLPYYTLNLSISFGVSPPKPLKGMIHFIAGINFSVDPAVYIWMRKSIRKKLMHQFRKCGNWFRS